MKHILTILFLILCLTGYSQQVKQIESYSDTIYYNEGDNFVKRVGKVYVPNESLSDTVVRYLNNPLGGLVLNCGLRDVINVNGTYHLFEEVSTAIWAIHKRTSPDGMHWGFKSAALLDVGASGRFDDLGQADPTVIYDGAGDWKMWYDALDGSNWDSLGYATSTDGTTWSKYGGILKRGGSSLAWDSAWIHHPAVIKNNGVYYMFYAGSRSSSNQYKIGLATSTNGINWTKYSGNPVISTGTTGEWDDNYIRPSKPFKVGSYWYMTYWGNDGTIQQIGLARSPNLYTWTKIGKLFGSGSGQFDQVNPAASTNIIEDGLVKIWYMTSIGSDGALHYASMDIIKSGDVLNDDIITVGPFTTSATKSIGDTIVLGTSSSRAANYIYFYKVSVASETTPDAIKIYIYSESKPYLTAQGSVKMNIYSNVSGKPYSPITNGATSSKEWASINGNEWNTFNFVIKPTLSVGDYWVGIWSQTAFKSTTAAGGASNYTNYSVAYGDWPIELSIAATYGYSDCDVYLINDRSNVWQVTLTTEPSIVYFNGATGNKQTSINNVNSEKDWYWTGNILYIYAENDPNYFYQIGKLK